MKYILQFLITVLLGLLPLSDLIAQSANQDQPEHSLFFFSNLEDIRSDAPILDQLQTFFEGQTVPYTILYNGDFLDNNGFEKKSHGKESDKIDRLIQLATDDNEVIFIPGDKEWDNSGKKGLKKVKYLEKHLEEILGKGKAILPEKGCPGPELIDINDHLAILLVNTPWFNHPHEKPREENTKCPELNEGGFWVEFDDEIDDAGNKNIVVVGHHPVLSYGEYAGNKPVKTHFLPPVIGSFIAGYHKNIGDEKDLSNAQLQKYSNTLKGKLFYHPSVIYVGGHEYDTQLNRIEKNYYINSGALVKAKTTDRGKYTVYNSDEQGFVRLDYYADGRIQFVNYHITASNNPEVDYAKILYEGNCSEEAKGKKMFNTQFNPCLKEPEKIYARIDDFALPAPGSKAAGPQYKANFLQRALLGKHYRNSWSTPVDNIPYLDLDTMAGGLIPYQKGGGAQTTSLKFNAKNGEYYAFRILDKNPTQKKNRDLVSGIYGDILKDLTASQHPYGPLVIADMMKQFDIPNPDPKLYLMPDDPRLGAFREEFAGELGWMELKPRGKKKGSDYRDADEVVSTLEVYEALLEDNDNVVDLETYKKVRFFEMLLGDWDRHQRNYNWLAYKKDKGYKFVPFSKDWDKALTKMQGLFRLMDWEILTRDMSRFAKSYHGPKSLNYKSRNRDRMVAVNIGKEEWMQGVKDFQKTLSDDVIDEAINKLPPSVYDYSADFLKKTFKYRRDRLDKAFKKYYKMLAKYIDIVGSNSHELFEINRLENGDVHVQLFKLSKKGKKKQVIVDRVFHKSETKEIRLYGLGKDDQFKITGSSKNSILVRIIGGKGEDLIDDQSKVRGGQHKTKVYDFHEKDTLLLGDEGKLVNTPNEVIFKSSGFFNYNYSSILPSVSYNIDDGLGLSINGSMTTQKFNKPGFGTQHQLLGLITTQGNYSLNVISTYRHVLDRWDMVTFFRAAAPDNTFDRFYGLGNETIKDEAKEEAEFFDNETTSLRGQVGLRRNFWRKSMFTSSVFYDYRNVRPDENDDGGPTIYDTFDRGDGFGETGLVGIETMLNLDFRNSANLPTTGSQFLLTNNAFVNPGFEGKLGGNLATEITLFYTAGIKLPVTFSIRSGYIQSYGKTPFYFKSYLGQQRNLRGFVRNRFIGESALYFNNDIRLHFGKVFTPLVPIRYGIYGLFDSGRVWLPNEDSDKWHIAYGGGIYLIPYSDSLNLNFSMAYSEEEDWVFAFRVGFFLR